MSRGLTFLMAGLAAVFVAVVVTAAQAPATTGAGDMARAELKDAKGQTVATAELRQAPDGVLVHLVGSSLPSGVHAFHIHEVGKCDPPDFKTAGGHFNPASRAHGLMDEKGAHAGDLPNIHVPSSGSLEIEALARGVTLQPGPTSLMDENGSALVIHAAADDYKTDPAGNAGARIACGVIVR